MLDLRDTASLVTGGASGLGEAAARLLAERGAKVVVADLNDDRGKQVAADLVQRLVDGRLHLALAGHVCGADGGADILGHARAVGLRAIDDHDLAAGGEQLLHRRQSQAGRAAGHQ
jgi:NAD(P)-dependent dehydrogenase (short-subunit alcohol dehydrogenase family)